ncbi:hypothetical protein [Spiroplasma endosymbiont of Amphibalanus improvisus]|uniref:hypothetical protein n=1 Tax=Spiroplasma endosymbiont of Amphibalanus improvisus TaxID=3066327 RepID=UPI00313D57EE
MIDDNLTGTIFPDLESLDKINATKEIKPNNVKNETFANGNQNNLSEIELERKRFSYANPLRHNDFSNRRMYWGSGKEIFARLMILFSQIANIAMAYCFGVFFAGPIAEHFITDSSAFAGVGWTVSQGVTNILIVVTVISAFLLYLPMILCRTAGSVYGWGISYIVLGILYFVTFELFYSIMLIVSGLISDIIKIEPRLTVIFLIATLVISALVIIGGCMLIVRSDDIKRRINVEK